MRSRPLLFTALLLGAAMMMFPLAWTVITSISPGAGLDQPSLVPTDASLDAYRTLLDAMPFGRILLNSLWIGALATLLQVLTSAMAAYAFDRLDFPGKNVLFVVYLSTLMVPFQVLVVPLFIEMKTFGLMDTYAALVMPSIASAFGVFLLRQAVSVVPRELDEAAFIDGAGHVRVFFQIVLPLIRPALATFAVFAFMSSWNSFLWPLVVIRSPELMTLPVGLANLHGRFTTQWDVVMAGSVVSVVPIALLYLVAQRQVIASVATSGLK